MKPLEPRNLIAALGGIALGLVVAGGAPPVAQDQAAPEQETQAPPAQATPTPATKTALVVPAAERNRKNPVPKVPEAIESGRTLFDSQCAMCHGRKGDGRGDLAVSLKMKIPNLTDPREHAKRTDGELFYILNHGHYDMPAEKRLVDQNKWEIIHYMRTLARPAPGS